MHKRYTISIFRHNFYYFYYLSYKVVIFMHVGMKISANY